MAIHLRVHRQHAERGVRALLVQKALHSAPRPFPEPAASSRRLSVWLEECVYAVASAVCWQPRRVKRV